MVDVAVCVTAAFLFFKESGWMHTPHHGLVWRAMCGVRNDGFADVVFVCWHAVGCLGQHVSVCSLLCLALMCRLVLGGVLVCGCGV